MKLLSKLDLLTASSEPSEVKLTPEEPEDMWHVYNLIAVGDRLRCSSQRKVVKETSTGSTSTIKLTIQLTLKVEAISFDPLSCELRVTGKNTTENEFVKMGQYHTLELVLNKTFALEKIEWDSVHLERLKLATDVSQQADLAAVVMHAGLAHVCLITPNMTKLVAKVETSIAKKRSGVVSGHEKSMNNFYDAVIEQVRKLKFDVVKACLVASPGFTRDEFLKYMFQKPEAQIRDLIPHKSKFISVHSSSGYKHALSEVLAKPEVAQLITETKAFAEVKALAEFNEMLTSDASRAYYGYNHCKRANEERAIQTLMVTDGLFRSADIATRRQYVNLVDKVRENGGTVLIFSSLHASGEQLSLMSGVAALLRYGVPDIDDDLVEPDSDDESARPATAAAAAAPVSTSATASSFGAVGWASAVLQPETTACASSQDAVHVTVFGDNLSEATSAAVAPADELQMCSDDEFM
jgi:protein pelota